MAPRRPSALPVPGAPTGNQQAFARRQRCRHRHRHRHRLARATRSARRGTPRAGTVPYPSCAWRPRRMQLRLDRVIALRVDGVVVLVPRPDDGEGGVGVAEGGGGTAPARLVLPRQRSPKADRCSRGRARSWRCRVTAVAGRTSSARAGSCVRCPAGGRMQFARRRTYAAVHGAVAGAREPRGYGVEPGSDPHSTAVAVAEAVAEAVAVVAVAPEAEAAGVVARDKPLRQPCTSLRSTGLAGRGKGDAVS